MYVHTAWSLPGLAVWRCAVLCAELSTKCVLELDGNEGITSMALVRFEGTALPDNSLLLAVGTAEQMTYFPTSCTAGYIRLYK
jgi:hypothetical protein